MCSDMTLVKFFINNYFQLWQTKYTVFSSKPLFFYRQWKYFNYAQNLDKNAWSWVLTYIKMLLKVQFDKGLHNLPFRQSSNGLIYFNP